ncbi:hypothetical protein GCM10027294_37380 [Marinactinospora endophytica]
MSLPVPAPAPRAGNQAHDRRRPVTDRANDSGGRGVIDRSRHPGPEDGVVGGAQATGPPLRARPFHPGGEHALHAACPAAPSPRLPR